jgi:phospholipid/cholesterol/gamma-HCH transport system ATP-binding protein
MNAEDVDPSSHAPAQDPHAAPAIELRGVYKSFGGRPVLDGVDLKVARGTTTVILGGSGSGKSVLMRHVIGLLKPDAGEIRIDGEEISRLEGRALGRVRRRFGMVFQNAALFDSLPVGGNVAFPLREHLRLDEAEVRRRVAAKLALVGLAGIEERMPAELSGGMRKRVALARAVILDPAIVLYDEPTTGLDPVSTDGVDELILTARRELGVTSLVISHDIGSAFKVADRIAFLSEGRIVEEGTPAELKQSRHPRVEAFLRTWAGKAAA